MLFKIAWRNLWRQPRRTWITAGTVAFGFWIAVTFTAVREYTFSNLIDTGALMGVGHVTVQPRGALDEPSLDRTIGGVDGLRDTAMAAPHVVAAVPRISGQALFAAAGRVRGGAMMAVDPTVESEATNIFPAAITEGAFFTTPGEHTVVMGRTMADQLGVGLGKKVVYTTTDKHGELVSGAGRVCGIYETGLTDIDGAIVLLPIDRARELLGYGPQEASALVVMVDHQRNVGPVQAALAARAVSGEEVVTWRETLRALLDLAAIKEVSQVFLELFIGLMIAAGVLNTLLMSVLERRREFGIMMAVGMAPARLFGMILAESVYIGAVGLALGAAITTPWALYLHVVGLDMGAMMGKGMSVGGVALDPIMRFDLPLTTLAGIVVVLFVLTLLAGLYPAWRAGRDLPVTSLRLV